MPSHPMMKEKLTDLLEISASLEAVVIICANIEGRILPNYTENKSKRRSLKWLIYTTFFSSLLMTFQRNALNIT